MSRRSGKVILIGWPREGQFDFRHLAALIPAADQEILNSELNGIYARSLYAQLSERDPVAKTTKRQLQRLWNSFDALERPALKILVRRLRAELQGAGIAVPESVDDRELRDMLTAVVYRAALSQPKKAGGPKGIGAQARAALAELVELYCRHTGRGKPYKVDGAWRRLEAAEFAVEVLKCWRLRCQPEKAKSLKESLAESLAEIWLDHQGAS